MFFSTIQRKKLSTRTSMLNNHLSSGCIVLPEQGVWAKIIKIIGKKIVRKQMFTIFAA